jgi:membrane-associated protease RseP (regulator of RpoE activity)
MSGPKHLWSGDWENESEEASAQRVREPRPQPEPAAAPPEHPPPPPARRGVRPWVLPVAAGLLVIAAAAFGLSKVLGSSHPAHQNTTSARNPLPARVTGNPRPIMWLGMELITAPPGLPVVETVRPNSNGDRAGLVPGDAILLINNRAVGSTGSISDAIKGMHSGDRVTLEVNNGGAVFTVVATLAAPPTPYP